MTERNWRDAKPKWAVEAAEAEIAHMRRRLALRWPDEALPEPVPFMWGAYDRLEGTPVAGEYWTVTHEGSAHVVHIREKLPTEPGYHRWLFNQPARYGDTWTTSVQRGPLYASEREAKLAALWAACDKAAAHLEEVWAAFISDRGFV